MADAVLGRWGWSHLGALGSAVAVGVLLEHVVPVAAQPGRLLVLAIPSILAGLLAWPRPGGSLAESGLRLARFLKAPRLRSLVLRGPSSHPRDWLGLDGIADQAVWFTDGSAAGALEVTPVNFELRAEPEQDALIDGFAALLNGLDHSIQILVQSSRLHANPDTPVPPNGESAEVAGLRLGLARHLSEMAEADQAVARHTYLLIPSPSRMSRVEAVRNLTVRVQQLRAGLDRMGLHSVRLADRELADLWRNVLHGDGQTRPWDAFSPADWLDLIAPTVIEEGSTACRLEASWYRTWVVLAYPRSVRAGWLSRLLTFPGALRISIRVEPLPTDVVLRRLEHKAAQFISSNEVARAAGRLVEPGRMLAERDVVELRERLQAGEDKLFQVKIALTAQADSLQRLNDVSRRLDGILRTLVIEAREVPYRSLDGFVSTLPVPRDSLAPSYLLDTRALATFFPFIGSDLPSGSGVFLGLNVRTGSPILLDRFRYENFNALILAKSGAGKSYLLKLELLRSHLHGIRVVVLDPQGEYHRLAHALSGAILRPGVAVDYRTALRASPFLVLDLRPGDVPPKDWLTSLRDALFAEDRAPRIVAVDEAWLVMREPRGAAFLCELAKTARKHWLGFSCATQDIDDFLQHPGAQTLITNASMQFLLRQAPQALSAITTAFGLREPERQWLARAAVGEALLLAGQARVPLRVVASPEEHRLITSDPAELMHIELADRQAPVS